MQDGPDPLAGLSAALAEIRGAGLGRHMRLLEKAQAARCVVDGREVLNFSSNDYLGLAADPRVRAAALEGIAAHGVGAGSARLIAGTFPPHRALEEALAAWKGTESALLFSSGYHANLGILTALAGEGDVIFSDALNHASIIDGCRLSRARTQVYAHRDAAALECGLAAARRAGAGRLVAVTDTVFGMDGTEAPLREIAAAARAHGALVVVDEAHAGGVLGPRGAGLAAAHALGADAVHVQMGTLGKALGAAGAFVAGARTLVDYLVHRARTFIFTTALPPATAAAAAAALRIAASPEGDRRRAHLAALAQRFRAGLTARGLRTTAPEGSAAPIVPVLVGDPQRAMRACEALLERRVWAQAIRPPTVPPGTERLRFAFTAGQTVADIDEALAALDAAHDLVRGGPLASALDAAHDLVRDGPAASSPGATRKAPTAR
ncbi:MAG TPA: 8-amino-7-oxononanoate synthase [Myxococcota bacterium]|nr:8-amino-7-oxononanoate synthase [Myxococcota bacterium]